MLGLFPAVLSVSHGSLIDKMRTESEAHCCEHEKSQPNIDLIRFLGQSVLDILFRAQLSQVKQKDQLQQGSEDQGNSCSMYVDKQ